MDVRAVDTRHRPEPDVVSMPCREWSAAQPLAYRDEVLPLAVRARVSVEAGVGQSWREVAGGTGDLGAWTAHRREPGSFRAL